MIRLVVVDDHPAIATAIGAAASAQERPAMELVGQAASARDAIELIARLQPDVVLCDIWIDGAAAGLDVLRARADRGGARFVILSAFDQPSFLRAAIDAGAVGYLSKAADVGQIIEAVVAAANGETRFDEALVRTARDAPRPPSQREVEAIRLIADGASNDEVATALGISVKTVESHLRRLFARYGLMSRTELAMLAVRQGWLRPLP